MAASALVGQSIGQKNIPLAKKYAKVILTGSVFINLSVSGLLYLLRKQVTMAYVAEVDGDSEAVAELTIETLPFLCIHLIPDLLQGVQGGIIRGVGLQGKAFLCALVCYYFIGLPIGGSLMFETELALRGSWLGIAICSVCVNTAFAILLSKTKWGKF